MAAARRRRVCPRGYSAREAGRAGGRRRAGVGVRRVGGTPEGTPWAGRLRAGFGPGYGGRKQAPGKEKVSAGGARRFPVAHWACNK